MKYTADQIAPFARNAGFTPDVLEIAIAIALAESGGDPDAYNPETAAGAPAGEGSYGLWQIYRKAHPLFATWNLRDPQTNACAASIVYQSARNSFGPWSTFQNCAYVKFLETEGETT